MASAEPQRSVSHRQPGPLQPGKVPSKKGKRGTGEQIERAEGSRRGQKIEASGEPAKECFPVGETQVVGRCCQ